MQQVPASVRLFWEERFLTFKPREAALCERVCVMDAAAIKERRAKELAEKKLKLEALRRAKQERQAAK